jgi:hypothetical protein
VACGVAFLFLLCAVAFLMFRKNQASQQPQYFQAQPSQPLRPFSVTQQLDELKYAHADLALGQKLGEGHLLQLGQMLAPAKPAADTGPKA